MKAIPIISKDESDCSIKPLKKNPKMAAGIVAMIIYSHNFLDDSLKVIKSYISLLVKINTANREATWRIVMRNRFGLSIKLLNNAKCPLDETGRNSVTA